MELNTLIWDEWHQIFREPGAGGKAVQVLYELPARNTLRHVTRNSVRQSRRGSEDKLAAVDEQVPHSVRCDLLSVSSDVVKFSPFVRDSRGEKVFAQRAAPNLSRAVYVKSTGSLSTARFLHFDKYTKHPRMLPA